MALKHSKVSEKVDDADATLIQPSDWNADHIVDSDGFRIVTRIDQPAAPADGNMQLFGKTIAGSPLPAFIGPTGLYSTLQPFIGRNKVGMWAVPGGTNTVSNIGIGIFAPTVAGTATVRATTSTNMFTSSRRVGAGSSATAGSSAGFRAGAGLQFWLGNSPGLGGFRLVMRFGCSDTATVAGARSFVGMYGANALIGNVDPSTLSNLVGVGTDSGDSNLHIIHNDGSGIATKINLGASFPDHTLSADLYELALFAAPNASSVGYQVTRLNTGDVASGTITTDLPVNTTFMAPQFWRNNGDTAQAVSIDMVSMYVETDY